MESLGYVNPDIVYIDVDFAIALGCAKIRSSLAIGNQYKEALGELFLKQGRYSSSVYRHLATL
jgi:hypothetical protein